MRQTKRDYEWTDRQAEKTGKQTFWKEIRQKNRQTDILKGQADRQTKTDV